MTINRTFGIGLIILAVLGGNIFAAVAQAIPQTGDGRSLRWDRFDVAIDNIDTTNNRFDVTETYELTIETGPFRFGYRDVTWKRLTDVSNVEVYEGSTRLNSGCFDTPGTFCAQRDGDYLSITYYFTRPANSGERRSFRIKYTVSGALRSYEDGDQLFWQALPEERDFPVRGSRVTVTLPSEVRPEVTASYPDSWREAIERNVITWDAPGDLGTDEIVEVRVQYPHNPAMSEPPWQNTYDLEQSYIENVQPIVSLLLALLTALITVGGILFVVVRYLTRGRDPKALTVPEYLTEPPTEERPGITGLLLDETADMQDIMATLIDLARRGYLVIEQSEKGGVMGILTSSEFEFHRTDQPDDDLKSYELTLLRGIFKSGQSTSLSALRTKFYQNIPAIKQQMYNELVQEGYFPRSPEKTRSYWTWGGIGLMVVASLAFWGAREITLVSPLIIVPPIGLFIVGAAMALVAPSMPAKTLKGAQDAAHWRAFRRYLQNMERQGDLQQAAQRFDQYIAYAVAFGLEKEVVRDLAPQLQTMPRWYFPTHLGGPWRGGYRQGANLPGGGEFSLGGPGGLNSMSSSLTEGLNSMSSGLTRMLNDASKAMTSRPSSKSGGGGFSGGGGHGGGSGGGRAGFG